MEKRILNSKRANNKISHTVANLSKQPIFKTRVTKNNNSVALAEASTTEKE